MSVKTEINWYYRAILSSITPRNSPENNRALIEEIIEADFKLVKGALDLILSGSIAKVNFAPNQQPTSQSFYSILSKDKTRQYLVMQGYCDCFYFAEHVLSRATSFTCTHELACVLLEHMSADLQKDGDNFLHSVEELDEEEFLERMHLLYDE
ncbi:hypothetical protein, conserved [Babesia bigemina]|uniref:SWIM-type domain-containing protein n=1 Tax=Babesia bigemina TaxID=5866 RepID=A0A061D4P4_BABBI|nr:hypothetical protein, conserved [Babesia bigemina]CDR95543.1 hypothetical protein, conserved [Babesia bigemina]|eukprot:XP_012767729.1 hypothetical protein, conserved [Babesia bigemina]